MNSTPLQGRLGFLSWASRFEKRQARLTDFPYRLHRAALLPLLDDPGTVLSSEFLQVLELQDEATFADFVFAQGLASLWHERLAGLAEVPFSPVFQQRLKAERFNATAAYLLQKNALATVRQALDALEIPHVIIKGGHFRELIYQPPSFRVASDIDLLVRPTDKSLAVEALSKAGFIAHAAQLNISHEMTLSKGYLDIDLHWDILRPGRTRVPLAGELIEQRLDYQSHWGPTPEATLFLMLVHPVITKYCTTPYSSVIRLLDIALWIERQQPEWMKVAELLERAGLKTAGWIMLEWLRLLTGRVAPEGFMQTIRPGRLRQRYLRRWIARNYSTRFLSCPLLIQLGFTLPVHDRLGDAWHALRSILQARSQA